jgi:hypothetical protein
VEWIGVAVAITGAVLLYSAVHNLSPWTEFKATLSTGQAPAAKAA